MLEKLTSKQAVFVMDMLQDVQIITTMVLLYVNAKTMHVENSVINVAQPSIKGNGNQEP